MKGLAEALTIKAMSVLERCVDVVEPPEIKSWEEIVSDEVGLLYKLVESM